MISVKQGELHPQREGDRPIMEFASTFFSNPTDIISVQRIRIFLGVVHIRDLCFADGIKLDKSFCGTK